MNINKKLLFPFIILFSALGLASVAAYFSIIGISTLFSGAALSVGIMALFLEIGKISSVSFAYRYWNKCKFYLKSYLVISMLILMIITSAGIAGMLMSAYQKSSIEYTISQEKIKTTEQQKTYYQDKITTSKSRIDALTKLRSSQEVRMNEVVTNEFLTRNPLQLKQLQQQTIDLITNTDKDIKEENDKIQTSIDDISKIDEKIGTIKLGLAEKKDVQTFKFVADALDMTLDQVAKWFILMIIFVFDPLAICLILAYNVIVYKKENESVYDAGVKKEELKEENPIVEEKQIILDTKPAIHEHPHNESKKEAETNDSFFKSYFKK
jgi:hypothetical protein